MNIKKILHCVLLSLLLYSCQKESDMNSPDYNFLTNVNINYNSDTISIGDTVWVESNIQGSLKDSATNSNIYFKYANIYLNMLVRSWGMTNQDNQVDNCSFYYLTPAAYLTFVNNAMLVGITYEYNKGLYKLSYGIIFNTAGIYSIDTDFLMLEDYFSENDYYLGGGIVEIQDMEGSYSNGYLKASIVAENNNLHLYESLTEKEKNIFSPIDENNESKYFFIKVNEQ